MRSRARSSLMACHTPRIFNALRSERDDGCPSLSYRHPTHGCISGFRRWKVLFERKARRLPRSRYLTEGYSLGSHPTNSMKYIPSELPAKARCQRRQSEPSMVWAASQARSEGTQNVEERHFQSCTSSNPGRLARTACIDEIFATGRFEAEWRDDSLGHDAHR